jgi:hypothetical protein
MMGAQPRLPTSLRAKYVAFVDGHCQKYSMTDTHSSFSHLPRVARHERYNTPDSLDC